MKKHWLPVVVSVLILSVALCGCKGDKKKADGNQFPLTVGIQQDIDSLDPHKAIAAGTKEILFNVYEGLVKPDSEGNLIPAIASEVNISPDGCEYTFTIRQGVKFHDGTTLDAEDVVYSLKRAAGLLDDQDPSVVVDSAFSSVSEISASGEEVKVLLSSPNTELLGYLTCAIIPKDNTTCDKTPIGTGPYKITNYQPLEKIELKKHDEYWGTPAHIEDVTFKIIADADTATAQLLSGAVDVYAYLTADQAAELENKFRIEEGSMGLVQGIFLNNESHLFSDIRVRQALCYAVNRQGILDLIADGNGTPVATDMFPSFSAYYNRDTLDTYPYNSIKAKELLKEAGYPNGIAFTLIVPSGYQYHVDTAQIVADQLKKSNIYVSIRQVDDASWLQDVYHDRQYDATLYGLAAKVVVPSRVLSRYCQSAGNNFINYKNDAYDALFEKALSSTDTNEKKALYKEMEAMLTDDAASVYLQDPALLVAVNPNLDGYTFYPIFVQDVASLYWK